MCTRFEKLHSYHIMARSCVVLIFLKIKWGPNSPFLSSFSLVSTPVTAMDIPPQPVQGTSMVGRTKNQCLEFLPDSAVFVLLFNLRTEV